MRLRGNSIVRTILRWHISMLLFFSVACIVLADPVRNVDFSRAPEMKDLAARSRRLGNEVYPQILTLLGGDRSRLSQHFDIVFKKRLKSMESRPSHEVIPGMEYRLPFFNAKILLSADWLATRPEDLDMILVHEMAHSAQDYKWRRWSKTPPYWREGIADYVCYKLGYTNANRCAECSQEFPDYTSGYTCAGAFLLYIDAAYGSNVISQLNQEIRRGRYSDAFFFKATGKRLDELWNDFKGTPAFTPIAAEISKLHETLGFVDGKPPADLQRHFEAYLKQRTNDINEIHRVLGYAHGNPPKDFLVRYELGLFMGQPAGMLTREAGEFMINQQRNGELPGFLKTDPIQFGMPDGANSDEYPIRRTFHCSKNGDSSLYNYTIFRSSKTSAWELKKAWRTGKGHLLEEFHVIQNQSAFK
jgi:Peptidase of plants and bacteria